MSCDEIEHFVPKEWYYSNNNNNNNKVMKN